MVLPLFACGPEVTRSLAQLRAPSLNAQVDRISGTVELHISTQVNGGAHTLGATCSTLGDGVTAALNGQAMQLSSNGGASTSVKGDVTACDDIVFSASSPAATDVVDTFSVSDTSATFQVAYASLTAVRTATPAGPASAGGVLHLSWDPATDTVTADDLGGDFVGPLDGGNFPVQPQYAPGAVTVVLPSQLPPGDTVLGLDPCVAPGIVSCDGGATCTSAVGCLDGMYVHFTVP
jgi:hypothetical protein